MEQKLKKEKSTDERFAFLYSWSPYHPYYLEQVAEHAAPVEPTAATKDVQVKLSLETKPPSVPERTAAAASAFADDGEDNADDQEDKDPQQQQPPQPKRNRWDKRAPDVASKPAARPPPDAPDSASKRQRLADI